LLMPNCNYRKIIASDNNPELIGNLKNRLEHLDKRRNIENFIVKSCDALNLDFLSDDSINKIVTDPPWGLFFDKIANLESFYNALMREFFRVLAKNGLLVMLVSKNNVFENALKRNTDKFKLLLTYSTLVSGQKASVYKIRVAK